MPEFVDINFIQLEAFIVVTNHQPGLPVDMETTAAHGALATLGMTNTTYRDLLCRATGGGNLSIEGGNSVAKKVT